MMGGTEWADREGSDMAPGILLMAACCLGGSPCQCAMTATWVVVQHAPLLTLTALKSMAAAAAR